MRASSAGSRASTWPTGSPSWASPPPGASRPGARAATPGDCPKPRSRSNHLRLWHSFVRDMIFVRTEAEMRKKLTRTGNSLALVLDKDLLEQLGIDAQTALQLSTDGGR